MKTQQQHIVRQGDVLFRSIARVPTNLARTESRVFVYGEATGHAHQLATDSKAILYTDDVTGRIAAVLVGEDGALVVHEEHGTAHLRPGAYEVIQQVEYDPEEGRRNVVD